MNIMNDPMLVKNISDFEKLMMMMITMLKVFCNQFTRLTCRNITLEGEIWQIQLHYTKFLYNVFQHQHFIQYSNGFQKLIQDLRNAT